MGVVIKHFVIILRRKYYTCFIKVQILIHHGILTALGTKRPFAVDYGISVAPCLYYYRFLFPDCSTDASTSVNNVFFSLWSLLPDFPSVSRTSVHPCQRLIPSQNVPKTTEYCCYNIDLEVYNEYLIMMYLYFVCLGI